MLHIIWIVYTKYTRMMITIKKQIVLYSLITIVIPIFIGAALYYFFCPDVWFVKQIKNLLGEVEYNQATMEITPLVAFIRNYFFDFIWAFALINALYISINNNAVPIKVSVFITVTLGIIMEVFQKLGFAKGTSDIYDIVAEGLGAIIGAYIINKTREVFYNEKI